MGSVFFKHVAESLKSLGIQVIHEFSGCKSLAFWMKLGFSDQKEVFESDDGPIPVIRYVVQ